MLANVLANTAELLSVPIFPDVNNGAGRAILSIKNAAECSVIADEDVILEDGAYSAARKVRDSGDCVVFEQQHFIGDEIHQPYQMHIS